MAIVDLIRTVLKSLRPCDPDEPEASGRIETVRPDLSWMQPKPAPKPKRPRKAA